jgi:dolichyl-phosphate beta-glucosyltransferase
VKSPKYSIIIPAYKEAKYIGNTLTKLAAYLQTQGMKENTEVIVISADANDNTAEIAEGHKPHFAKLVIIKPGPRVGKGRDVTLGFQKARGDYQLFMDADLATPLHHLKPAMEELEEGSDVVIGIRDLSRMHESLVRKVSSNLSNLSITMLAVAGISDTQCGFKGFTKQAAEIIFSRTAILNWGIDIEILAIADLHNMRISEIAIPDWKDPKGVEGLSGDSQLSAMVSTLKELFKIRKNKKKGAYA